MALAHRSAITARVHPSGDALRRGALGFWEVPASVMGAGAGIPKSRWVSMSRVNLPKGLQGIEGPLPGPPASHLKLFDGQALDLCIEGLMMKFGSGSRSG